MPAYDLEAERARYAFDDVERGGVRLNRGTAAPQSSTDEPAEYRAIRVAHGAVIAPTTLAPDSPVIELDRPTTGIYVASRRGVYLDLYQGVAQRLFDDARIRPRLTPLIEAGLLLRREINTDDYLGLPPAGVHTPQELGALVAGEMQRAFPRAEGYRAFFSNSGTEAIEAALKVAMRRAYLRVRRRYGAETWAALCDELGIARDPAFSDEVWRDYPLFAIALHGAFHGRTLGSLALTESRSTQRIGYPAWRWVVHVSPERAEDLLAAVEWRPLPDLLATPGALRSIIEAGRVPADLLAGAFFEPFQGEGGYRAVHLDVLRTLRTVCDDADALLIADEVQSFARGGATFYTETTGISPDVVCLAKAAILGITLMPAEVAADLDPGWHSNTFGSGRLFDVNYAYGVIDTYLHERDPLFAGLSFADNEAVKGERLHEGLQRIAADYPQLLSQIDGRGSLWGFSVPSRPEFLSAAWQQGAKLLGAGGTERPGRVRLILPADVLTREVDAVLEVLRATCVTLGDQPSEGRAQAG